MMQLRFPLAGSGRTGTAGAAGVPGAPGLVGSLVALLALAALGVAPAEAQITTERPLRPIPPGDQPVVPFMEGWYDNGDGSVTISFGYYNLNRTETVEIPLGEGNRLEPAQFDGIQPSSFVPGRQHGVFAVTLPAEMRDEDVWWHITGKDGEVYRVPGRAESEAYQLDRNPRPHGTVAPLVWFDDEGARGSGPEGVVAAGTESAVVGSPLTLTLNVLDPSERDPEDRRFREPIPARVFWLKHQGPGDVTFTRHESTPESQERVGEGLVIPQMRPTPRGPQVIVLPEGRGTARVVATFSEPGDYILRARVDNWSAPDSNALDQCCWSNAFVRVSVEE